MDSLAVSTIGLAAGGWQNVKLAGIYTTATANTSSWKLGIVSFGHPVGGVWTDTCSTSYPSMIVAPGSRITGHIFYLGSASQFSLVFSTSSIVADQNGLFFTAVLFRW